MGVGLLFAVLTGLCWAVLAIILKYALQFASSGTIVWMRMVWAFLLLLLFFAYARRASLRKVFLKAPWLLILGGLLLSVNYFAYMHGLELTSAANAQIMIQIGPLTYLFLGVFYFKEKLRWQQWIGIIIAVTGFSFFYWDQLIGAFKDPNRYAIGNLWILLGAVTWAGFAAIQKHFFTKGWSPAEQNLLVYGLATLALLPMVTPSELPPLDTVQWAVLGLLGLNTLVAYGAFAEANQRAPASYVSLIITCNPLLTIFLLKLLEHFGSTLVEPEPIAARGYLGAFLVVSGVGLAVSMRARLK
jgi:drug/metabolite transporter (DMT)-like permease